MNAHATYERREAGRETGPLPTTLETTGSKLVYLYLNTVGEATIDELRETLDMQMLALYPMLGGLERDGLVEREGDTFAVSA